jgi:hypothetical protein
MVFNATFNTILAISWLSVLLVEETGVPDIINAFLFQRKTICRIIYFV